MQNALKLALVDPKHLEYRDLNKSSNLVAKAGLSMDIRQLLNDPSLPDDLKMKMYRQTLDRFLKIGNKLEDDNNQFAINYEEQPLLPPVIKKQSVAVKVETDDGDTFAKDVEAKSRKRRRKEKQKSVTPSSDSSHFVDASPPTPPAPATPPSRGRAVRRSSRRGGKRQLSPIWAPW